MFKKRAFILMLSLGCSSVFAANMPHAPHTEEIAFKLAENAAGSCKIPAPIVIHVAPPSSPVKHLTLDKDSAYVSIHADACNNMNKLPGDHIRNFTDTIISNDGRRIIVMHGIYDPVRHSITGDWSDNFKCNGPMIGTAR